MSEMDLTDKLWLKILRYLPIPEIVRIGCVSQRFQKLSKTALQETTVMDFADQSMERLMNSRSALVTILRQCSNRLEKVLLPWMPESDDDRADPSIRTTLSDMACAFGLYEYPNLTALNLANIDLRNREHRGFVRLLESPNLRRLLAEHLDHRLGYKKYPHIESLKLINVQMVYLPVLRNYSNLKHAQIDHVTGVLPCDWDTFFSTCPCIESLSVDVFPFRNIRYPINRLRKLVLGCMASSGVLKKLSNNAPNLEVLELKWVDPREVSKRSIAKLTALKRLIELRLSIEPRLEENQLRVFNGGIRTLVATRRLQVASFAEFQSSTATIHSLIYGCRELKHLHVGTISGIWCPKRAAAFIRSISGVDRPILLKIDEVVGKVWKSEGVKTVLKELEASGSKIQICLGNVNKGS